MKTFTQFLEQCKSCQNYVTSPSGQRIKEFPTPGTKDPMPIELNRMKVPRKPNEPYFDYLKRTSYKA